MALKPKIVSLGTLSILTLAPISSFAKEYTDIYPFVPADSTEIHKKIRQLSEDPGYLKNFYKIHSKGLSAGKTFKKVKGKKVENKPWTSTYWPLNRGLIADAYEDNAFGAYNPVRLFSWEHNRNRYKNRADNVHKKIDSLSSEELAKLAPSEKYDLLLGDKEFDLTNKLWAYMQSWGSMKQNGDLHSLDKVGGKYMKRAQQMLDWGWYTNIEDAKENALKTSTGLAEKFAQEMVTDGKFSTLDEALPTAIKVAKEEQHNYVLKEKNTFMATWEGICHGWSTSAGVIPRPRKSVTFKLKDGRDLKFYPTDIKGLVSLLWANSLIQDSRVFDKNNNGSGGGIIMEGLRCNEKSIQQDEWGRYYDHRPDYFSKKLEPRCVGVHPAVWHLGLTNIIGKQGRSFIVERKVKAAVDNHPMYSYKMEYFNPYNGTYSDKLENVVVQMTDKDQFKAFRHKDTKYIVGVKTTMTYLDWERPKRKETDSEEDDSEVDKKMMYDLELDKNGVIVGGQWRAIETGKIKTNSRNARRGRDKPRPNHSQPDFFWVVTKDWKGYFNEVQGLEPWTNTKSAPPKSWAKSAAYNHNFIYNQTNDLGFAEKCEIVHKKTKKMVEVPCEYKISKPQPLLNVVNKLIDLAK